MHSASEINELRRTVDDVGECRTAESKIYLKQKKLIVTRYCTSGEVTRSNNNVGAEDHSEVMLPSKLCMSQVWICECWKIDCSVCKCTESLIDAVYNWI